MGYTWKDRLIFIFVLVFGILFLYGSIHISYNIYDEGIVVYGASRVLKGDIPYRDFWTMYAPGQFYIIALLFRIFGEYLFITRLYSATVNLLIVLMVYYIVKRVSNERLATLSLILSTLWMGGWGLFHSSPTPAGTLWCLFSIYFVIDFLCLKKVSSLILGGIITGVTVIFRHDIGGYTFISSSIVILSYVYLKVTDRDFKDTVKIWVRYLLATVVGFLPFAIYFLGNVPLKDLVHDLIIFPARVFPKVRDLPYPNFEFNLHSFLFYFPVIMYILSGILIIADVFRLSHLTGREWVNILLLILGIFFFNQVWVRSDVPHLLPTIIPAIMLLSSLYESSFINVLGRGETILKIFLLIIALILTLALYLNALKGVVITSYAIPIVLVAIFVYIPREIKSLLEKSSMKVVLQIFFISLYIFVIFGSLRDFSNIPLSRIFSLTIPGLEPSRLEKARGIYVFQGQETYLEPAIRIIQANTKPDESIFVGNSRHDRIFVNDIMFYFLCGRHSATKYHELHPGLATTREIQLEIIKELKENNVKFIVLWSGAENVLEPNESAISSGVNDLTEFIRMNYVTIMYLGPYSILQKMTSGDLG